MLRGGRKDARGGSLQCGDLRPGSSGSSSFVDPSPRSVVDGVDGPAAVGLEEDEYLAMFHADDRDAVSASKAVFAAEAAASAREQIEDGMLLTTTAKRIQRDREHAWDRHVQRVSAIVMKRKKRERRGQVVGFAPQTTTLSPTVGFAPQTTSNRHFHGSKAQLF